MNYNTDESFRIIDQILDNNQGHIIAELMTFMKYALLGDKKKALACVTDQLAQDAKWDDLRAHMMAECYALIDEHDSIFMAETFNKIWNCQYKFS